MWDAGPPADIRRRLGIRRTVTGRRGGVNQRLLTPFFTLGRQTARGYPQTSRHPPNGNRPAGRGQSKTPDPFVFPPLFSPDPFVFPGRRGRVNQRLPTPLFSPDPFVFPNQRLPTPFFTQSKTPDPFVFPSVPFSSPDILLSLTTRVKQSIYVPVFLSLPTSSRS